MTETQKLITELAKQNGLFVAQTEYVNSLESRVQELERTLDNVQNDSETIKDRIKNFKFLY